MQLESMIIGRYHIYDDEITISIHLLFFQIIVGSFLPSTQPEHKPKKQKPPALTYPTAAVPALPAPPEADKDEARNGQGQLIPPPSMQPTMMPSPFQREAWPNAHSHNIQDSRKSATDINISLPGGMH